MVSYRKLLRYDTQMGSAAILNAHRCRFSLLMFTGAVIYETDTLIMRLVPTLGGLAVRFGDSTPSESSHLGNNENSQATRAKGLQNRCRGSAFSGS